MQYLGTQMYSYAIYVHFQIMQLCSCMFQAHTECSGHNTADYYDVMFVDTNKLERTFWSLRFCNNHRSFF